MPKVEMPRFHMPKFQLVKYRRALGSITGLFTYHHLFQHRETSVPPVARSTARKLIQEVPDVAPRTSTMTFSSSSPWDSTGFYYSPRYPQSHRGTHMDISQGIGALLWSKMAFFKREWWKVKVMSRT